MSVILKIMINEKPVFAELFGLVLFDLKNLARFKQQQALGQDLLVALTTTDLGTQVSENGVAIPIGGIAGEYYHIAITNTLTDDGYLTENQIIIRSKGWLLESVSGEVIVCGIGYLKQFDEDFFVSTDKFPRLPITRGWNEIEIVGGNDENERPVYELLTKPVSTKPVFSGNFEDSFDFITD